MKVLRGKYLGRSVAVMMLTIVAVSIGGAVFAQTTRQAEIPSYENEPIRRSTAATTTRASVNTSLSPTPNSLVDVRRVLLSLVLVLSLIFVLRWVGKRFFPNVIGPRVNQAVKLLTRSQITPKQHVLLVQVGRRVLVVGDNGTQMNALSEITDPDEVAHLIGQITAPHIQQDQEFDAAFGKAKDSFEPDDQQSEMPDPAMAEIEPPVGESNETADARSEIKGLMDKVRGLSKQFGKS